MTATNPRVFLEISVGGTLQGRLEIELYANKVPRTAENFRMLCTGEKGVGRSGATLCYKDSLVHKIIPGFLAQGGDFIANDGTQSESVYGPKFEDENFAVPHDDRGIVSMANNGRNTNGGQFFITFASTPWLNGKNVAFGKVVAGLEVLDKVEDAGTKSGTPKKVVKILKCGEVAQGS
jgi:peptidylprolyl isomerase